MRNLVENTPGAQIEEIPAAPTDPQGALVFHISGVALEQLAQAIAQTNIRVYELCAEHSSLEQAYMELTHGHEQYAAQQVPIQRAETVSSGEAIR
jgi:ABC-2 type transport system ATP-binding protein